MAQLKLSFSRSSFQGIRFGKKFTLCYLTFAKYRRFRTGKLENSQVSGINNDTRWSRVSITGHSLIPRARIITVRSNGAVGPMRVHRSVPETLLRSRSCITGLPAVIVREKDDREVFPSISGTFPSRVSAPRNDDFSWDRSGSSNAR